MKNKEKIYSIAASLLIADQLIKLLVKSKMTLFDRIDVIPKFFSIYYIENDGAAFSIFGGKKIFLILVGIIALVFLDIFITKEDNFNKMDIWCYGMVISGIIGNLIDRCLYGRVIDYLSFNIFGYSFPIFNFADIMIVVGVLLLIVSIIKNEKVKSDEGV